MTRHPLTEYPIVGAFDLDCGLCPVYFSAGKSRFPGCCGPDFCQKRPTCSIITRCVKQENLETCAQRADWQTCEKIAKRINAAVDSAISYKPIAANFALIQKYGIEDCARLGFQKQELLIYLIENHNDGRSKSFYCASCQLLPLDWLKEAAGDAGGKIHKYFDIREKAGTMRAAIRNLAENSTN